MNLDDLNSLKLALDTNNPDLFYGDWTTALAEVVDSLIERENDSENLACALAELENAQLAVQLMMEEKTNIISEYENRKQLTVTELESHLEGMCDIIASVI